LFKRYAFVFSICPLTKSVHEEGGYKTNLTREMEIQSVLMGIDKKADILPVKAVEMVQFPGENFVKSSVFFLKDFFFDLII